MMDLNVLELQVASFRFLRQCRDLLIIHEGILFYVVVRKEISNSYNTRKYSFSLAIEL